MRRRNYCQAGWPRANPPDTSVSPTILLPHAACLRFNGLCLLSAVRNSSSIHGFETEKLVYV